jgi:hypothetical protein
MQFTLYAVARRGRGESDQAHEAMTSAPKMYAEAVTRFLLS